MNIRYAFILLIVTSISCKTHKKQNHEAIKNAFLDDQKTEFGISINNYLNNNYYFINSLNQSDFTNKIDSLKNIFITHLNKYKGKLDKNTFNNERLAITFFLDKYILNYPLEHEKFTGEKIILSKQNQSKLNINENEFNNISLLSSLDYIIYMETYIKIESNKILKSEIYDKLDNQQLHADWNVIDSIFTNSEVSDFWKHKYLYYHINNLGIKNIDKIYSSFVTSCKTSEYIESISTIYNSHKKDRDNHIIETYKEVEGFKLDMHLFLPNSEEFKEKRPTIIQFHGGSWSEGKPDWFFSTAEVYAKQGWVVGVVEYRIKGKQGTYPFEAVKDAKSALRWIRENAEKYNIDSNKIIVTGNSAGGHLSLATTLVDNWNESTDNLKVSAKPNVIIVNSGVYDLTTNATKWIAEKMQDRDIVKEISPNHLLKKSDVKMLLIHGDKDKNCPYENAEYFYKEMKLLENDIELYTVKNAEHLIWYGKHSAEVSKITREYIRSLNY